MNPETYSCDCGYTWRHGHSGTHLCGPQYRATIERQAQEIEALKAAKPAPNGVQMEPATEDDAEQLARRKWAIKQWYEHVGAWENAQGEVCFGSVMALGAMLKLMAKARISDSSQTPIQEQEENVERQAYDSLQKESQKYKRMFESAFIDMGLINEHLGLDQDDDSAKPIIAAIEELRALTPMTARNAIKNSSTKD